MTQIMSAAVLSALLSIPAQAFSEPVSSDRLAVGIPAFGDLQGELVELQADGGSFIAVFQARQRGEPRGGVVLLHDQGTKANGLEVIRPLRLGLAEAGWDTLSLQLPLAGRHRDSAAWQSGQTSIQARLQAGLDWLQARKAPALAVIAQGDSGSVALGHAENKTSAPFQALVLVSMPLDSGTADKATALLGKVRVPLLDVYAERDHVRVTRSAEARSSAAAAGQDNDYTQAVIAGAGPGFFGLEDSLLSRIRSWLTVKAVAPD